MRSLVMNSRVPYSFHPSAFDGDPSCDYHGMAQSMAWGGVGEEVTAQRRDRIIHHSDDECLGSTKYL